MTLSVLDEAAQPHLMRKLGPSTTAPVRKSCGEVIEEIKRRGLPVQDVLPVIEFKWVGDYEDATAPSLDGGERHPGADSGSMGCRHGATRSVIYC